MMAPFFSVVIPTYNRADYIIPCLKSVFSQSYRDLEVILVDDGSSDKTKELLTSAFAGEARLKYQWQDNQERAAARNKGIHLAKGSYIVFLDSDDVMLNNHLAVLKSAIDKNPGINFLATKFKLSERGELKTAPIGRVRPGWYGVDLVLKGNVLNMNGCVRRLNEKMKLFNENRSFSVLEDWMFWVENLVTEQLLLLEECTITVNVHPQRSLELNNPEIANRRILAQTWLLQHVPLKASYKRTLTAYSYYFAAIHHYLDQNRVLALQNWMTSVRGAGLNWEFISLLGKILVGRKLVLKYGGLQNA